MLRPRVQPHRAQPEPQETTTPAPQPPMEERLDLGVHPLMISSLPPMASGADVYVRQFYRGSRLPFRRYLPLSGL